MSLGCNRRKGDEGDLELTSDVLTLLEVFDPLPALHDLADDVATGRGRVVHRADQVEAPDVVTARSTKRIDEASAGTSILPLEERQKRRCTSN